MSRQTPRRGRHQQNPSGGGRRGHQGDVAPAPELGVGFDGNPGDMVHAAAGGIIAEEAAEARVSRGNEVMSNMNLHVLRRYEPSVRSIDSVAASTVVYVLNYETGGWEKPEPQVEGTLFLCDQEPLVIAGCAVPRACVFVLNRKGLMNVVVDLATVNMAEVTEDLITLRIEEEDGQSAEGSGPSPTPPVLGFWIHGGTANDVSQFDPNNVLRRWQYIRSSLEQILGTAELAVTGPALKTAKEDWEQEMAEAGRDPVGLATQSIGRRPSINELVAAALGPGGNGGIGTVGI